MLTKAHHENSIKPKTMTESSEIKTYGVNILVTDKMNGQDVLLVGIKSAYRNKPQYLRSLKREYARCHKIEHPNIIKCIGERDFENYGHCIVLEWEPARTLADYMRENHDMEEKKNIIHQLADALGCIHANSLVHGAINPSCVFITDKGDQVKLLNIRLHFADMLSEPAELTKYRAPEAKDGTVVLDARTDIFSLGTILKELNINDEYSDVIEGSTNFARNDRFPDIETFLEAFEHRRVTLRKKSRQNSGSRHDKRIAAAIAAIAAIVGIAVIFIFNRNQPSTEAQLPTKEVADTIKTNSTRTAPPVQTPTINQLDKYSGDLEFLNDLVPQMHVDLDKIYASASDNAAIHAKVSRYYKGLRKALGNKTNEQFAAYDKEFADYVNKKNAGL